MPVFVAGDPIESVDPMIVVEGLGPGTHRFRLEVEDDAGNRSLPDEQTVVVRLPAPTHTGGADDHHRASMGT